MNVVSRVSLVVLVDDVNVRNAKFTVFRHTFDHVVILRIGVSHFATPYPLEA